MDADHNYIYLLDREYDESWNSLNSHTQQSKWVTQLYLTVLSGYFAISGFLVGKKDTPELSATGVGMTIVVFLLGWFAMSFLSHKISHIILFSKSCLVLRQERIKYHEKKANVHLGANYVLPAKFRDMILPGSWKHLGNIGYFANYFILGAGLFYYFKNVTIDKDEAFVITMSVVMAFGIFYSDSCHRFIQRLECCKLATNYNNKKIYEKHWRLFMKNKMKWLVTLSKVFAILIIILMFLFFSHVQYASIYFRIIIIFTIVQVSLVIITLKILTMVRFSNQREYFYIDCKKLF